MANISELSVNVVRKEQAKGAERLEPKKATWSGMGGLSSSIADK
jgi:hypothetical protein